MKQYNFNNVKSKMSKQYISIISIVLVGLMYVTPFLSIERCDMPCCEIDGSSCCDMEKSIECPMEMSECRVSAFFPLLGAPLNQTDGSCDFEEISLCQNNQIIKHWHDSFPSSIKFVYQHPPEIIIPLIC